MNLTKNVVLFTISMLFVTGELFSQSREVKIGEKVPDIVLGEPMLGSKKLVRLSDFKGKLVIIDFWSTTCTPCVKAMPKMDSLQKIFGDKVAILPIMELLPKYYNNGMKEVAAFWRKNSFTNRTSFVPLADTTLNHYFPHKGVPYEVWINGDGILVGLTQFVNGNEIQTVLDGNFVDAPSARKIGNYDFTKDLLIVDKSQPVYPVKAWYSVVTDGIPTHSLQVAMAKDYIVDTTLNITKVKFLNRPIPNLYQAALLLSHNQLGANINQSKRIFEVSDSSRFFSPLVHHDQDVQEQAFINWQGKHSYCYQSVLPGARTRNEMSDRMIGDLNNFFGLSSKIEKRLMDCWVIVRTSKDDKLLFSNRKDELGDERFRQGKKYNPETYKPGDASATNFYYKTNLKKITKLIGSVELLRQEIGGTDNKLIIIDETGIEIPVNLAFDIAMHDGSILENISFAPENIGKQLKQYGLDLIKAKREIEVFVIRDKDYKKPI